MDLAAAPRGLYCATGSRWVGTASSRSSASARPTLLFGAVTVQNFRITHNNGDVEIVTAKRYRADGLWIIFQDKGKHEVHRLNEREVRGIDRL